MCRQRNRTQGQQENACCFGTCTRQTPCGWHERGPTCHEQLPLTKNSLSFLLWYPRLKRPESDPDLVRGVVLMRTKSTLPDQRSDLHIVAITVFHTASSQAQRNHAKSCARKPKRKALLPCVSTHSTAHEQVRFYLLRRADDASHDDTSETGQCRENGSD